MRRRVIINLMIINTNIRGEEDEAITYIRTLANQLDINRNEYEDNDSLAFSRSETESLKFNLIVRENKKKKRKQKSRSPRYKSPYRQSSLSIKKIMSSKGRPPTSIVPFDNLTIQDSFEQQAQKKTTTNIASPRYLFIPPLIQRLERNEADKMKAEARMIYEKREKEGGYLTNRQKKQKWADFLLRERRWQAEKNIKIEEVRQRLIDRERQNMNAFKSKSATKINVEEHIKSVKRKKLKLQEQLREVSPNYYTWRTPAPPSIQMQRMALKSKEKNPLRDRIVQVQSKRQVQFLISQ